MSNLTPFVSGPDRVRVIELFTSEGCSSCPPADAWLNRLMNDPELWRSFVPVAYHVDYWDHIGWRDRFADADFSDRQRRYAALHDDRIHTPAFFINGGIWRGFFSGGQPREAPPQYGGVLSARGTNGGSFILSYRNDHFDGEAFSANGVLLGNGISSKVSRGENSGRTLIHDFVVLRHRTIRIIAGQKVQLDLLPAMPRHPAARYAVAFWISSATVSDPTPLQAVGGFLIDGGGDPD